MQRITEWCSTSTDLKQYGILFLVTYCFLLRLPSEALPITVGKDSGPCALYRDGEQIKLALRRRSELHTASCRNVVLHEWSMVSVCKEKQAEWQPAGKRLLVCSSKGCAPCLRSFIMYCNHMLVCSMSGDLPSACTGAGHRWSPSG